MYSLRLNFYEYEQEHLITIITKVMGNPIIPVSKKTHKYL